MKNEKMKKNSIKIFTMLLCLTLLTSTTIFTNAQNVSPPENEGAKMNFISIDDETGIANDGLPIKQSRKVSGTIWSSTWYAGTNLKVVEKAIATGESNIEKRFVKYLTGSWAKAEDYSWSKSNSASWSISASATAEVANAVRTSLGLSASRTTTYSVTVKIPAIKTKYSKLGFANDYFRQNYKYTMTVDGKQTQSHTGYIDTPTKNSYLIVYYQK
ncbi:MAG: hypothetical protein FWE25_04000 [Lachnospiraceae bacterium]|nr:hypothetical protein [Lachnospiraceae bacterium]